MQPDVGTSIGVHETYYLYPHIFRPDGLGITLTFQFRVLFMQLLRVLLRLDLDLVTAWLDSARCKSLPLTETDVATTRLCSLYLSSTFWARPGINAAIDISFLRLKKPCTCPIRVLFLSKTVIFAESLHCTAACRRRSVTL
jgi:hypothetical protein